ASCHLYPYLTNGQPHQQTNDCLTAAQGLRRVFSSRAPSSWPLSIDLDPINYAYSYGIEQIKQGGSVHIKQNILCPHSPLKTEPRTSSTAFRQACCRLIYQHNISRSLC